MTIHFYLDDDTDTKIESFFDIVSNPFKVGDTISFEIDDIVPADFKNIPESRRNNITIENNLLREMLRFKKVQIVREGKYVRTNVLKEPFLTIEYHCVILD